MNEFYARRAVPTSHFLGLATALRDHFGGGHGPYELGAACAMSYYQQSLETNRAFADRILYWFAKDLGSEWERWYPKQRQIWHASYCPAQDHPDPCPKPPMCR